MVKKIYETWKKHAESTKRGLLTFVFATLCTTIYVVIYMYRNQFGDYLSHDQSDWGTFGDYFGGTLNPILSFVAFLVLTLTFRQQLKDGERADKNHREILDNQRFFELLSLTHEAARGVDIDDPLEADATKRKNFQNHRAIGRAWNYLKSSFSEISDEPVDYQAFYNSRIEIYKPWRSQMWPSLGSYFETVLFMIQRYVHLDKNIEQSEYCMRAIRNQMTVHERNILFYEMLNSQDCHAYMKKFKSWNFWRGGGDGMDAHRSQLIDQAVGYHRSHP
ncbi:hypothetical protein IAE33_000236 [Pseudomonas sp. S60]|uniref:hypothetical protein n=1 Tax=Pseudomonas sp. S60 TaxID=211124 RepID=UPI0019113BA3|nr:hypothetical protein [Pseudomonas sp. S60]MBK5008376.1 hypothetical protein [Pseudomonas sp. S60]